MEVDLTRPLLEKILVMKKTRNNCNDFESFVDIEVENLPKFYGFHGVVGHVSSACKRR